MAPRFVIALSCPDLAFTLNKSDAQRYRPSGHGTRFSAFKLGMVPFWDGMAAGEMSVVGVMTGLPQG
jgi:hypothetical protein